MRVAFWRDGGEPRPTLIARPMSPQHAGIWRVRILSWPKNVEVSQAHRLQAVAAPERSHVMLACKFANGVGRNRVGSHVLHLLQRWRIAIRRGRCRVDYASHFRIARPATSKFKVASTLERFVSSGSLIERGTDGIAAWCST